MKFVKGKHTVCSQKLYRQQLQTFIGIWILASRGNRIMLQKVDKFCYVADLLDADGVIQQ